MNLDNTDVTIGGVRMSAGAAGNVEWAGVAVADDLRRVRAGLTREELLAHCLDGAEDATTIAEWHEYVADLFIAAERTGS
jgi:hypothetical protein